MKYLCTLTMTIAICIVVIQFNKQSSIAPKESKIKVASDATTVSSSISVDVKESETTSILSTHELHSDNIPSLETDLAEILEEEPDRAEETLKAILENNPDNPEALGELIFLLEGSHRRDEAKEIIQTILLRCSHCVDARLALGEIHLNERSYTDAIDHFKHAAKHPPSRNAALRKLYTTYLNSNQTSLARRTLDQILTLNSAEIHRLKRLGVDTKILDETLRADRKTLTALELNNKSMDDTE